jgi:hypothetical protein
MRLCNAFVLVGLGGALLMGCAEEALEGDRFLVDLQGVEDNCNAAPATYGESFEYRVMTLNGAADVYLGEALLGSGTLSGCSLAYSSPLFTDDRDDGVVRWLIEGVAEVAIGGSLCDAALDWDGTETIKIVESSDPSVSAGCTYVMAATGSRLESAP